MGEVVAFEQRLNAQHGRFMIVPDIEKLSDAFEGPELPDDVVAFCCRRLVMEFRLGRALEDEAAAYRLHKRPTTIARFRRQHGEFMAMMDGAGGHARRKFFARRVGTKFQKSSNKKTSKPAETLASSPPEIDSKERETLKSLSLSLESADAQSERDAAPPLMGSASLALEGKKEASREPPQVAVTSPIPTDSPAPPAANLRPIEEFTEDEADDAGRWLEWSRRFPKPSRITPEVIAAHEASAKAKGWGPGTFKSNAELGRE